MPVQLQDADDRFTVEDSELPEVKNGDDDTSYTLRPITVEDHRVIVKKNTGEAFDRRSHTKVPVTNWGAVNDDVLDFVLLDWKGILRKGQPAPCEREQKLRLDSARRQALMDLAGMNQIERAPERRAESFPESA